MKLLRKTLLNPRLDRPGRNTVVDDDQVTAALQECDTFVDTLYGFSRTAAGC